MAYEYCCFVSYPHGQNDLLVPLVKKIVEALEKEIGSQIRKQVWLDKNFLNAGNRLDPSIGSGLCKSACMVFIYTPLYFDSDHIYCAQEFKAMQDLEEKRLQLLKAKTNGLIIPIILRGEKKYPFGKKWTYYPFTDIEMNDPVEQFPVKYAKEIRKIAEYIVDRCDELDEVDAANPRNCAEYLLPTEDDARQFIETILKQPVNEVGVPFVGRTKQ